MVAAMTTTQQRRILRAGIAGLLAISLAGAWPLAQGRGAAPAAPQAGADTVPSDLRPLLTPRRSEMRLVTQRYTLDRA